MLGLVATEPGWAARMRPHLDELLLEQAHLEKKAAAAALAFLFRYPDEACLQQPLADLAREELEHFLLAFATLRARGLAFARQRPGHYAAKLQQLVRGHEPERLLDSLLVGAVIEARSCERMLLLARELRAPAGGTSAEPELLAMYETLVAAEARHHAVYLKLAHELFPPAIVDARLARVLQAEAGILAAPPLPAARLHA